MKKIAIVIDSISSGGIARVCSILSGGFFQSDNQITIYSVLDSAFDSLYHFDEGITFSFNQNHKSYISRLCEIKEGLKQQQPDSVLVLSMGKLSVFFSLLIIGMKSQRVSCEHIGFATFSLPIKVLKVMSFLIYDKVAVLTNIDKKRLSFLGNKVECICNPSPFEPVAVRDDTAYRTALAVGHLIPRKSYDRLLPIWAKFIVAAPEWKLRIVGCGECFQQIDDYITLHGLENSVEIISETTAIDTFYATSSVLLSTSRAEGLPMTFIEAMSFGIPVIAYDVPTGPADLIDDGINGYLIEDGNEHDFLQALNKLLSDEKLAQLSEGAQRKSKLFTIDNILKDWDSFLNEHN